MADELERARAARTWLERLGARIPGYKGYQERELRREVDQVLRAELAGRLDRARDGVRSFQRRLRLDQAGTLARLASADTRLDQLANTLRHAGSGYAGLFDAVKVREDELGTLYRFDLSLVDTVDALLATASALADDSDLGQLEAQLADVGGQVESRDRVVRSVLGT
ncbi:MAG TPA: hypothetical protein PLS53_03400 [Thermoanaerobaculaceae bacterium]|nr:hypothetical protein [Thermoanaerobaculaceae bacterium]HPS77182.1 hypothetical protein [Thermoanaerobaculaceae bacterium]